MNVENHTVEAPAAGPSQVEQAASGQIQETQSLDIDQMTRDNYALAVKEQPPLAEGEQPPDETDKPTGKEGTNGEGSDDKPTEDQGTTANPEGQDKPEGGEQAPESWSEEQSKYMQDKGLELAFTPESQKALQIIQDSEKKITESTQSISQLTGSLSEIATAMQTDNVQGLVDVAKDAFGVDLSIDTKSSAEKIQAETDNYNSVYENFGPTVVNLTKEVQKLRANGGELSASEVADYLESVGDIFSSGLSDMRDSASQKISEIQKKEDRDSIIREARGITGAKSSAYENWAATSESFTTEAIAKDPASQDYIKEIQDLMGPKSAFEAAGLPVAKIFGHSLPLAKAGLRIGKALHTLNKLESGDLEKDFHGKFTKAQAQSIGNSALSGTGNQLGGKGADKKANALLERQNKQLQTGGLF
jgi:hypothetical protein